MDRVQAYKLYLTLLVSVLCCVTLTLARCRSCQNYFREACQCLHYQQSWTQGQLYAIRRCEGLASIPRFRDICGTGELWDLDFSNNGITEITPYAFANLPFFNSQSSSYDTNPAPASQGPKLRFSPSLVLANNDIEFIASEAFSGGFISSKLEILDLTSNKLTTFPDAVLRLSAIKQLKVGHNNIESVPSEIQKLSMLQVLDLSSNQLRNAPEVIGELYNLTDLMLDGNPIEGDLSHYLPLLSRGQGLGRISWPHSTMTCSCSALEIYVNATPSGSRRRLPTVTSSGDPVTCDRRSHSSLRGQEVGNIAISQVRGLCGAWDTSGGSFTSEATPVRRSKLKAALVAVILHVGLILSLCTDVSLW